MYQLNNEILCTTQPSEKVSDTEGLSKGRSVRFIEGFLTFAEVCLCPVTVLYTANTFEQRSPYNVWDTRRRRSTSTSVRIRTKRDARWYEEVTARYEEVTVFTTFYCRGKSAVSWRDYSPLAALETWKGLLTVGHRAAVKWVALTHLFRNSVLQVASLQLGSKKY